MTYNIGVDSGGTHVVAMAWDLQGHVVAQGEAGPGNILMDQALTIQNITSAITTIFDQVAQSDCQQILIGIAGIETTNNQAELATLFKQRFSINAAVISDAYLALVNGLEGEDGTLIISGTGSIVYGQQNKQQFRVGGWGNLLGDEGSAYSISREALQVSLQQLDRGETSQLQDLVVSWYKVDDVRSCIAKFYQLDRQTIASFAEYLAQVAAAGNQDAKFIFEHQAQLLAEQIVTLLNRYVAPKPMRLAFSGSVLENNADFRQLVLGKVQEVYTQATSQVVTTNNSRAVMFWRYK